MKSNLISKQSKNITQFAAPNAGTALGRMSLDFDPSLLRIPKSASPKRQYNIAIAALDLFQILVRSGVKLKGANLDAIFELTNESDAVSMLLTEHQDSSWKTEPQVVATGKIITDLAAQAMRFRNTFVYVAAEMPTFKQALEEMEKIAVAVGILADYDQFTMDIEMAATGLRQYFNSTYYNLFSVEGICNRKALYIRAKDLISINSINPVKTVTYIHSSNSNTIASTVRRDRLYKFFVGKIDTKDSDYMERLAKHIEFQRKVAVKALRDSLVEL